MSLESKAALKKYHRTSKGKYNALKNTAKTRGIFVELLYEEYKEIILLGCHYCKTTLLGSCGHSLDRIDNDKGYFIGNILPCCGPCNYIRGEELTVEETEVAILAVLEFRRSKKS